MIKKKHVKNHTTRETALSLLARVEHGGAFADRVLAAPQVSNMEERDRLFIRELLLGVLRWKLRLDRIIETFYNKNLNSLDPEICNILRLGLFQLMFMGSVPDWAAVNESVTLAHDHRGERAAGLVNAILRRFSREGEPPFPDEPSERLSFETSHPLWLVKRWITNFGEEAAESILKACNEKHPVFIRVNTVKIAPAELIAKLLEEGFVTVNVSGMPHYFSIQKASGLFETKAFNNGFFTVQDPSAAMAAELLAPVPGESIVELCAAPGGKTTHCAVKMNDCGHITAVDISSARLGLVKEAVKRLGLKSVECVHADAQTFGKRKNIKFDRVLLDAPCSGTGVFSKRLDMKWRIKEDDVKTLAKLQRELLQNAAGLVKQGGVLVYSTCALESEENENNVAWFLESHKNFSLECDGRFEDYIGEGGYLILPHQMNGIGAFAAKLKRE